MTRIPTTDEPDLDNCFMCGRYRKDCLKVFRGERGIVCDGCALLMYELCLKEFGATWALTDYRAEIH